MRLPHNFIPFVWGALLAVAMAGPVLGAPPAPPANSLTIPDYGGRDTPASAMTGSEPAASDPAIGLSAPNPLAQAWRACEALVLVLGGIVTVVYGLKRFGIVREGDAKLNWARGLSRSTPGNGPIMVLSSQSLPGGAMLHVVSTAGQTFLLAATPQTVSLISVLPENADSVATPEGASEFSSYLNRANTMPPAVESAVTAATDRLKSLLARSQETGSR